MLTVIQGGQTSADLAARAIARQRAWSRVADAITRSLEDEQLWPADKDDLRALLEPVERVARCKVLEPRGRS